MSSVELLIIASHWQTISYITIFSLKCHPPVLTIASFSGSMSELLRNLTSQIASLPSQAMSCVANWLMTSSRLSPTTLRIWAHTLLYDHISYFCCKFLLILAIEIWYKLTPVPQTTCYFSHTIHTCCHLNKFWMNQCSPMFIFLT